jgi:hypothetical protein
MTDSLQQHGALVLIPAFSQMIPITKLSLNREEIRKKWANRDGNKGFLFKQIFQNHGI